MFSLLDMQSYKTVLEGFKYFCSRNIRKIILTVNDVLYEIEDVTICNHIFTTKTSVYSKRIHYIKIKCCLQVCCALYYAIAVRPGTSPATGSM